MVNVPTNKGISKDRKYYGVPFIYKQRPTSPHSSNQQKEIISRTNGVKTYNNKQIIIMDIPSRILNPFQIEIYQTVT